jgi:hypothetical protein
LLGLLTKFCFMAWAIKPNKAKCTSFPILIPLVQHSLLFAYYRESYGAAPALFVIRHAWFLVWNTSVNLLSVLLAALSELSFLGFVCWVS